MRGVQFLVLRVATQDLAYYAVTKGDGRTWVYDVITGKLTVHATLGDSSIEVTEAYVRTTIDPLDIPAHVRAGFGAVLKAASEEAVEIAGLMGVSISSGVQNSITAPVIGHVGQFGNIEGGVHFQRD